jgi:hypothetical protein
MQTTINEWLNKHNGFDKKICKYFYLEWKEGDIIPSKCIFMKTIPQNYNFKHQFKWNLIYYNIELYGNLPNNFVAKLQNSEDSYIVNNHNMKQNNFVAKLQNSEDSHIVNNHNVKQNNFVAKLQNSEDSHIVNNHNVKQNNLVINPQNSDYSNIVKKKNDNNKTQFLDNKNIISCLKSHLQKCIRRNLLGQAIYTADLYMDIDIEDFLRRLTIIMIEDCFFHSSYIELIWFMIAFNNNNLKLNKLLKEYLLGVVYFMIKETKYRESYYMENESVNFSNLIFDMDNKGNSQYISFIYSILIRKSYGGMECDMKMLERSALIWYNRLMKEKIDLNIDIFLKKKIRPITIYKDQLKKEDWFLGAIDFHTHPNILKWLKEKFEDYEEEDIKNAIWYFQSSINYRKFYNEFEELLYNKNICQQKEKYKQIWESIQKELYSMRLYLLKKLYEDYENNLII